MKLMTQVTDRCSQVDEMISVCVCNTEIENYMYGACTSCPSAETSEVLLHNELDDKIIEYKQWVVQDKANLMNATQKSDKLTES
jgi:Fe-S cluster biogenesis protein NfuA